MPSDRITQKQTEKRQRQAQRLYNQIRKREQEIGNLRTRAREIEQIQYTNFVPRDAEIGLVHLVQRNALLSGILRVVVANVSEGGVSIHIHLADGTTIHPDSATDGQETPTRWVPLVSRMVLDLMTLGYTVVIIQPHAEQPEDRVFAPDPETVQVRWTTINRRRVYAAFDAPVGKDTEGGANDGADPIPNSFVLVVSHPSHFRECTSPVSRCKPLIGWLETLMENFIVGDTARTHPSMVIQRDIQATTKPGVQIPYVLAELTANGTVEHRVRPIGSSETVPYPEDAAAAKRPKPLTAANGQCMEFLLPGESATSAAQLPQLSGHDSVAMINQLVAMIGREMGVSPDYLHGGEAKLVAGVETSRKQMAVTVNSLQVPIAHFLEHVFARSDESILREMFANSSSSSISLEKKNGAVKRRSGGDTMAAAAVITEPLVLPTTDVAAAAAVVVATDTEVIDTDPIARLRADMEIIDDGAAEPMSAFTDTVGAPEDQEPGKDYVPAEDVPMDNGGRDKVAVAFNNTPYVDLPTALQLFQNQIITEDALLHTISRMFCLPESLLTPKDAPIRPFDILVRPFLHDTTNVPGEPQRTKRAAEDADEPSPKRQKQIATNGQGKVQEPQRRRVQMGAPPPSTA